MEHFILDEVAFYPLFGEIMPDGRLLVPTSSSRSATGEALTLAGEIVAETGGRMNGRATIEPEHPHYAQWLEIIRNKEQHLKAYRKRIKEARDERRRLSQTDDGEH